MVIMLEPHEHTHDASHTPDATLTEPAPAKSALAKAGPAKKLPSRAFLVTSWAFVFAMLALIFFMSAKTDDALNSGSGIISLVRDALMAASSALFGHPVDVSPVGHFTEFFLLGLALVNALRLSAPLPKACAYAVLFASLYGVSDELHQIFVPGRSCDPADWLVDTIAALIAALLFAGFMNLKRKRKKSHT